jgi:hypothetical protein
MLKMAGRATADSFKSIPDMAAMALPVFASIWFPGTLRAPNFHD